MTTRYPPLKRPWRSCELLRSLLFQGTFSIRKIVVILISGIKKALDAYSHHLAPRIRPSHTPGRWTITPDQHNIQQARFTDSTSVIPLLNRLFPSAKNQQPSRRQDGTQAPSTILVISKQPLFSEDMMEYSLDMATKRNAEIVAMNLDEQERDFEVFQEQARNNVSTFLQKARKAGVYFSHMVCDGPEERIVDHLHVAIEGLTYIMDDVPALLGANHAIPVYVHSE